MSSQKYVNFKLCQLVLSICRRDPTQLWKVSQDNFNRTSIDIVFLVCSSPPPPLPREKPVVSWFVKGYKHKCRRSYFIQDLDLLVFEARFSSEIDVIFKLYSNYKTCSIQHKLVLLIESNLLNPFGIMRYPHKNIWPVPKKVRFLVFQFRGKTQFWDCFPFLNLQNLFNIS